MVLKEHMGSGSKTLFQLFIKQMFDRLLKMPFRHMDTQTVKPRGGD